MGCIFSEGAAWVTEGHGKIREYRRRRWLEIRQKRETPGEHFHCDWEILDAVRQAHTDIVDNCRKNDHVTSCVIQTLVDGMMVIEPQQRRTAQYFLHRSRRIHQEAKEKLRGITTSRERAPTPDLTVSDMLSEGEGRRMPPNAPPGYVLRIPVLDRQDIATPISMNTQGSMYSDQEQWMEASKLPHPSKLEDDTWSDSSQTSSLASSMWSSFSQSSAFSYASSDSTLKAAMSEVMSVFMGDEELQCLFANALSKYDRGKFARNGVRLLHWFGRRLMMAASRPVEKEAAKFFVSRNHDRDIMQRIVER